MVKHNPLRAVSEIREQLASEKRRLGFFFGAGTSMSVGIPGIDELTNQVLIQLKEPFKSQFERVKKQLPEKSNVENMLDRIRTILELIGNSEEKEYDGLKGYTATTKLNFEICETIRKIVSAVPLKKLKPHLIFAQWLRSVYSNRYNPVEIFTTNYDLLLEQAMEQVGVLFFDGFIGSVSPFFAPESVEADEGSINQFIYPPRAWTRLWKMHGSINWFMHRVNSKSRITRLSGKETKSGEGIIIFPSREKYAESRKLPFISFQDRFRKFLSSGEALVMVVGYNFSDEHINEIVFQGLRSNPRLAITALMYGEKTLGKTCRELPDRIIKYAEEYKNLSIYGPDKACIGGITALWDEPNRKKEDSEVWAFWDEKSKYFTLGDFNLFASYLETFVGFRTSSILSQDNISSSLEKKVLPQDENKHEN